MKNGEELAAAGQALQNSWNRLNQKLAMAAQIAIDLSENTALDQIRKDIGAFYQYKALEALGDVERAVVQILELLQGESYEAEVQVLPQEAVQAPSTDTKKSTEA